MRVKLNGRKEKILWGKVEEEGITNVAEETAYSREDIYNWRSKNLYIPYSFADKFVDVLSLKKILVKGSSRFEASEIYPGFEGIDELATRVKETVSINRDGVPVYTTAERSLRDRFSVLLDEFGDINYSLYRNDGRYLVRYPKHVNDFLMRLDFQKDLPAYMEESGRIRDEKIILDGREIYYSDIDLNFHSDRIKYRMALSSGNEKKLKQLIRKLSV